MVRGYPATVARRIAEEFLDSGACGPGARLPSVRELRKRYGVSATTVAQALGLLQAQGRVSKQHGRGTFVTERTVGEGKTLGQVLGLVLPGDLHTGCLTEIYNGVERAAREQGWSVVVSTSDYRVETEREQVQRLLGAGIEAVVLVPVTRTRLQLRDDYLTREFRGAPLVLVDSAYPEQGHSQVLFDNYGAGQALTRHLISRGHRRIAFVDTLSDDGEPMMHRSTRDRHRGYVQALRGAGLEVRPEDIWSAARIRPEPSPATDLLLSTLRQAAERPTAVLALDDSNALDLIHAAAAQGIRVPNDLAVVGFDNTRAGRSVRPPFPTTDPDFRRAGELAVDLVLRTLSGELTTPVTYLLPVPLIRLPGEGDCVSGRDGLQRSPGERSDHGSRYNPGME